MKLLGNTIMNRVPNIIRSLLDGAEFSESDAFGKFINERDNSKKVIVPGGVYGFFAKLNKSQVDALYEEAKVKKTNALKEKSDFKPIIDDIYPIYWGKDKSLGSRINAHINNPDGKEQGKKGTGLIRLCAYKSLEKIEIGVFTIVVNNYSAFESHVRSQYPDLLKTKSTKLK
jgi:hypothetical protein